MQFGTRGVLALIAATLMAAAVIATRRDRGVLGVKLMTAAFAVASLWSLLSVYWAQSNASLLSSTNWLALTTMAVTATIYYGYKSVNGVGLKEQL